MQTKKKLCKFKQNCPQFIAKTPCGFDHVLCKFNDSCKDKQKCMFYHMAKPVFDKPKNQTLCKFNTTCSKPNCPFKHQKLPQTSLNQESNKLNMNPDKFKRQCKFGVDCKKKDCLFIHPHKNGQLNNNEGQNQNIQQNNVFSPQLRQQNQIQNSFQPLINRQNRIKQSKFCINYILNNQCQNGQGCSKSHEFCDKNSIKRVYFTTDYTDKNINIIFFQHTQINQQGQNIKEIIYPIQQNQTIMFKKLISASNLYQDIGGIDPSLPNKTYLRSITNDVFKAESTINGIQGFKFLGKQYLVYGGNKKIVFYNMTKGQILSYQSQRPNPKITGCVLIQQKGMVLVSTSQQEIKRFDYNGQRQIFEPKPLTQRYEFKGLKLLNITQTQILGQKIIFGITSDQNKVIFLNKDLKSSVVQFPVGSIINDADITLSNNKIPICLISVTLGSRQHQVVSLNLLNMQKQVIMLYQQTSGLNKIRVIQNHLLVEIKNKGFLVYKMNQFERQIGMIPFMNEIKFIQADGKGNLLIHESNSIQSKGSISIFKIRRI